MCILLIHNVLKRVGNNFLADLRVSIIISVICSLVGIRCLVSQESNIKIITSNPINIILYFMSVRCYFYYSSQLQLPSYSLVNANLSICFCILFTIPSFLFWSRKRYPSGLLYGTPLTTMFRMMTESFRAVALIADTLPSRDRPPLKSSQTSQPGLRSCSEATVLKSALQRAYQR